MSADECIHGLHPTWCAVCLHGVTKPAAPPTIEATFFARFEGQCHRCDLPIAKATVIHRLSDGSYCHEGCQP
jgi:hypothetical protein